MPQQENDFVPPEVEDAINTTVLVAGGVVGLGSLLQLSINTLETGRPLQAVKQQFGITKLERGLNETAKTVNGAMEEM